MSRGSMARSSMISPMTCPLFTLISRESSRSISSTQKAETLWANKHWVPDPKIQFEQNTMKGTVQMNLRSHTSVPNKLEVPNVNLENSASTSLFSFKLESQTLSKTIDIYAVSYDSRSKTNVLRCSQSDHVQQNRLQEVLTRRPQRNQNWSQIQCDT